MRDIKFERRACCWTTKTVVSSAAERSRAWGSPVRSHEGHQKSEPHGGWRIAALEEMPQPPEVRHERSDRAALVQHGGGTKCLTA